MDTLPVSEARDKLLQLIKEATNDQHQFRITSDEGTVVVLPEETYDNILVTLEILSTPGLLDQVKIDQIEEEFSKIEELPHALNH